MAVTPQTTEFLIFSAAFHAHPENTLHTYRPSPTVAVHFRAPRIQLPPELTAVVLWLPLSYTLLCTAVGVVRARMIRVPRGRLQCALENAELRLPTSAILQSHVCMHRARTVPPIEHHKTPEESFDMIVAEL